MWGVEEGIVEACEKAQWFRVSFELARFDEVFVVVFRVPGWAALYYVADAFEGCVDCVEFQGQALIA